jgi:sigma-B regulation protein RsbU (phosphoserine phosphatase)
VLELKDFFHLPQVEPLVEQLVADGPGLVIVAGLDPRPLLLAADPAGFLPSGRAAIFRILMRQMLDAHPGTRATVVAEPQDAIRVPRALRRRVESSLVQPGESYVQQVDRAASRRTDLLVIGRLCAETASGALAAAGQGMRVLTQLDTVFRGADVARQLAAWGASREQLDSLNWIVSVQRLSTLCARCKEPVTPDPAQLSELHRRYLTLDDWGQDGTFFKAVGCEHCSQTGREGEITAFDIFRTTGADPLAQPSQLPLEAYMLGLAAQGILPLDDVLQLEADQLRRTYSLLTASESVLTTTNTELERKLAELEAANRVLQQRTEALISLQGIGQALITSTSLHELAAKLCTHAGELCGADRAILYFLHREEGIAEVLSVCGWDPSLVHQPLEAPRVFGGDVGSEPTPFNARPPGVPDDPTDVTARALRAGLRVPLIAQDQLVGLMIVHTSEKSRFAPGEVALLQTFANQAALAIQRTELTEALQDKIVQLEAAQAELVQKERLERELELARQVQQSVLPRTFPLVPGYSFAARNEPARQVGGDFYDVILLGAHRFGLVVGDVSDKGMPAALYMALTRSLLLAEARRTSSPCAVLANVHRLLQELGRPGLFVTVFYGVVDVPARKLTYARAGHDRPLLLREGRVESLRGEGTFLGFPDLDELHLTEEKTALQPDDRLVLYTDGLTDVLAPDGRTFGLKRLKSLLQTHARLPASDLCQTTFTDLAAFRGDARQYDDMTMLVVEVK